jgi:hypothetical protein
MMKTRLEKRGTFIGVCELCLFNDSCFYFRGSC